MSDLVDGVDVANQDAGELLAWMTRAANTHPQAPPAWVLWHTTPDLPFLLVGLRGETGALWWNGIDGDYRPACGTGDGGDHWVGGMHHTEFPPGSDVPGETVARVVREFMRTGVLPTAVRWVETA